MNNSSITKPPCPSCGCEHTVKNGTIHNKKQKYKCQKCGRQFINNPTKKVISPETKQEIEKLLLEKISLAGIVRATKVSKSWLQKYVNKKYVEVPRYVQITQKKKGKRRIECDEMWSYCGNKKEKQWIGLALDKETKEIVGAYIGKRDKNAAKKMWESLPPVYRQCAVCYTDFWESYAEVIPSKRHKPVGKETGLIDRIERFNNTIRQRVSRLVRKTLSFSQKLDNSFWGYLEFYSSL